MSKNYLKFVEDEIINDISKRFKVTKEDAKDLFAEALSRNLVVNEIFEMIEFILEDEKGEKTEWKTNIFT